MRPIQENGREAHALFQPTPHDPPFVVAVLLDKTQKRLKMMYHLSWLKSEQVNAEFFRRWMHHALTFPLKQRKKDGKKNGKKRPNTVKRKGLAVVQPTLFAELFQIRVSQVVAAKVEFYIHAELHLIEVNLELPFSQFPSASVVEALLAHTAFSDDPHHVTVIPTLEFFDPTRHLFRPHADHPLKKPRYHGPPSWTPTPVSEEVTQLQFQLFLLQQQVARQQQQLERLLNQQQPLTPPSPRPEFSKPASYID